MFDFTGFILSVQILCYQFPLEKGASKKRRQSCNKILKDAPPHKT